MRGSGRTRAADGVRAVREVVVVAVGAALLSGCGSPASETGTSESSARGDGDDGGPRAEPLVTTDGEAIRVHSEDGRLVEELFDRLDGTVAGLQLAPDAGGDEPPAFAYAVEGGDEPAVLISRQQDNGAPSLFGDEDAGSCDEGTPMQDTSGPAWSPDGDAVAVVGLCPGDVAAPDLRLIVEGVDVDGEGHEELGSTSWTRVEQRPFDLGEGDARDVEVELVRWQGGGEAEQLIFVVRRGESTSVAQLGIHGRDDDLLIEQGPLEPLGPPAATDSEAGDDDPRQIVAVDAAGHGAAVNRDSFVLSAVAPADVDGMHDLRLDALGPQPHALAPDDDEAVPLPDELVSKAARSHEMFGHWLVGGADRVVVGDGEGRAWAIHRDGQGVAEIEATVTDATVRDERPGAEHGTRR